MKRKDFDLQIKEFEDYIGGIGEDELISVYELKAELKGRLEVLDEVEKLVKNWYKNDLMCAECEYERLFPSKLKSKCYSCEEAIKLGKKDGK